MAQIPLSQIPNAPDLASVGAPQLGNANFKEVDLRSEKAAISNSYNSVINSTKAQQIRVAEQPMQDVRSAGLIGASVAEAGQGVYRAAKTLADKQQELNDNAAWAEFSTSYDLQKSGFEDSLQQSNPATWTTSYADFRSKNVDPMWSSLPASVQQKHYGEYLKMTYGDQIAVSHAAFQKNIADSTAASLTNINLQVESNQFEKAKEGLKNLHAVNGIGGKEYETQKSLIDTAEQSHIIDVKTLENPLLVKKMAEDAMLKDEQIPGFPNIDKDQNSKIALKAQKVFEVQQDRSYGKVQSDIVAGNIKSSVDLEKDPTFLSIADEKNKTYLRESLADQYIYTLQGDAFTKDAINRVKRYPSTDNPAREATEIRAFGSTSVPSIYRGAINDALDSKIKEMASNGGRLKPETELIQYGVQRLSVARDGGVFGKYYSDADVKKDSSGVKAKANIEVMKLMEDVETTLRNSGVKTRAEADKVIETATAAGRAKQAAGDLGNNKGWFDFLNSRKAEVDKRPDFLKTGSSPQTSNGGFTPIGDKSWSVTSYGYPGDTTPDKNSSAGIGAFTRHLTRDSFGTSYDVEEKLRQAGVKPGGKVNFKLSNGQVVTKVWHDRGATPEQARKLGLRNYYGRVDFYSPDAPHELAKQGVKVVGFKPYTENGQG